LVNRLEAAEQEARWTRILGYAKNVIALIAELRLALKVARAMNNNGIRWDKNSPFAKKMRELLSMKLKGLK